MIIAGSSNTGRMSLLISLHFASITCYTNYTFLAGIKVLQCVKLVPREGLNPLLIQGNSYILGCEMPGTASSIQLQQNKLVYQSLVAHLMNRDALMIVSTSLSPGNTNALTYYVLVPPRPNSLHGNMLLLELTNYDLMLHIDEQVRVDFTSDDGVQRGEIDVAMDNILTSLPYEVMFHSSNPHTLSPLFAPKQEPIDITNEIQTMNVTPAVAKTIAATTISVKTVSKKSKKPVDTDEIVDDDL